MNASNAQLASRERRGRTAVIAGHRISSRGLCGSGCSHRRPGKACRPAGAVRAPAATTTIASGGSFTVEAPVRNSANVGRSFTVTSAAGDITGGAVTTPVYLPAGATGLVTANITPTAAVGTVVQGVLEVISNTSISRQTDVIAALPYTYTVGPAAP